MIFPFWMWPLPHWGERFICRVFRPLPLSQLQPTLEAASSWLQLFQFSCCSKTSFSPKRGHDLACFTDIVVDDDAVGLGFASLLLATISWPHLCWATMVWQKHLSKNARVVFSIALVRSYVPDNTWVFFKASLSTNSLLSAFLLYGGSI